MPNRKILLVEDNDDDALLTERALRKGGVANAVVRARNGAEALDYLLPDERSPGENEAPVVVLLDLRMPLVDGLEVLERVRADERTRLLPVVILTSSREEEDVARGYRLGANSYVRKPVESEAFSDAVRQLGLYWLVVNEAPPLP